MSLIKTISARIEATESGFTSTLNKIDKSLSDIESKSKKVSSSGSKYMNSFFKTTENLGNGIQRVGGVIEKTAKPIDRLGKDLTNRITKPVLVATTAIGGMVTALGFKRLIAVDQAEAKLKGLGHSIKDIGEYGETVREAVDGTLLTYAEGMDITAGGLAVGIEKGKDMHKYIKMIGNASVAMNREAGDTAQIFNRIVGGGRLMTEELNQIEHGMPGFSKAMSEHLGVTQDEFRKMLSEGKVSSEAFLVVMEQFSGNLSEEYAKTFTGLARNSLARIGRFGERVLSQVFEQSKGVLGQFAEFLKSPELAEFGDKVGVVLGDALAKVINKVEQLIKWFMSLSTEGKKFIGIVGLVVVAIGPLLSLLAVFLSVISSIVTKVGAFISFIGKLGPLFTTLTGPVGLIVLAVGALATAFIVAYSKSETFRNGVNSLVGKVKDLITWFGNLGKAIFSLFNGDWLGGISILQRLGFTPEQIIAIENFVLSIKAIIHSLKENLKNTFNAILVFFGGLMSQIKTFWNENGEQTLEAFRNAWILILKAVQFVSPLIQLIFKGLMLFIQLVWQNIKGVIQGTLNVILGLVKVFTGIFTGDFSKMWEGVKQIFVGAIQFVWNAFQLLFYGRLVKGVANLVRVFAGSIKELATRVIFSFKNLFIGATRHVTGLYNKSVNIVNLLRTALTKIVTMIKNKVVSIFSSLRSNSTSQFINLRDGVVRIFNRIRSGMVDAVTGAKTRVVNLFKDMVKTSKNQITELLKGVTSLPGKMKDGLIKGKDKVAEGIKSLGNKMTSTLGNVVNSVIGGINTVMGTIGIKKRISKWDVPKFSTGTGQGSPTGKLTRNGKIAMDTLAVVGDKGTGNGTGTRELVHYPNGQVGLYDNDATIYAPKGTTIFSNKETENILNQIPKFSKGTGFWDKVKNVGSKVKSVAKSALDYITDPTKLFNKIVDNAMQKFSVGGFMKNLGQGLFNKAKESLLGWVKDRFSEASIGKKQKWNDYPITTPYSPYSAVPGYPRAFNGGRHYGIDYGMRTGVNITSPFAGTVTRQSDHGGGIVARLKTGNATQYFLHMSSVKTGKVGIGDSLGRSGNTGAYTTGPHLHWQHEEPATSFLQNRNTKNPLKTLKGYMSGGIVTRPELAWLAEGGFSESIISHDPKYRVKSKAIYDRTGEMLGFETDKIYLQEIINLIIESNNLQNVGHGISNDILNKESDIYLDKEIVGKRTATSVRKELNKRDQLLERYRK